MLTTLPCTIQYASSQYQTVLEGYKIARQYSYAHRLVSEADADRTRTEAYAIHLGDCYSGHPNSNDQLQA